MTFNINSAERTHRTKILTRTATDATLSIDRRHLWRSRVFRLQSYHGYGAYRTVTRTVAAGCTVDGGKTVFAYPHRMAHLHGTLLGGIERQNSSYRTHLRTIGALRTTITALVAHLRLHESTGFNRWTQCTLGAFAYTQLT